MKLTPGKKRGLEAISNQNNVVLATAMDQRGSLGKMIRSYNETISYEEGLTRFKEGVSEILGNQSSSLLLDPEYGWQGAEKLEESIGLIMAYEKTGYDASEKGRLPNLVDFYAVQDLVKRGTDAIKLLIYYDTDEEEKYNDIKKAFIKRVGDECKQNDVLFILEPVSYSAVNLDSKGEEFAKRKPQIVEYFMEEFSKEEYSIDLLKVEVPVQIFNIEGNEQYDNYTPIFTQEEAREYYRRCSKKSKLPFIYLSGGVTNEQFIDTLHFAKDSGSRFNGCLCGRAIWKDGVQAFAKDGKDDYYKWLKSTGLRNLEKVTKAIEETATPWDEIVE
ncbi:tagatose 1,6-diphosphate aldolase [Virgibacillus doumboii]|uniref:tagatose 1,6-diphosphate aldolase n=1 Tax=Virgibacillus doumboii TaxID=2697503 RepID=UPI0013DF1BE9|nr:tagatose 1,6-diphosphate aldolase [Virgibacillus doumboii]